MNICIAVQSAVLSGKGAGYILLLRFAESVISFALPICSPPVLRTSIPRFSWSLGKKVLQSPRYRFPFPSSVCFARRPRSQLEFPFELRSCLSLFATAGSSELGPNKTWINKREGEKERVRQRAARSEEHAAISIGDKYCFRAQVYLYQAFILLESWTR